MVGGYYEANNFKTASTKSNYLQRTPKANEINIAGEALALTCSGYSK